MNAIDTYLDHMFRALPKSGEVRRARTELGQMAEDRFQELTGAGVSEHEAVGRVISQFGNLDDLADDLGIRTEFDRAQEAGLSFDESSAENFLLVRSRGARLIGFGVMSILFGLAGLIALGPVESAEQTERVIENFRIGLNISNVTTVGEAIGLVLLFLGIIIGVGLFIYAGATMSKFEGADYGIALPPDVRERYRQLREAENGKFAFGIASGVGIILLAVSLVAIVEAITGGNPVAEQYSAAVMMVLIGLAGCILVTVGMRRSTLSQLAEEGDYHPRVRDSITERFAGAYWLLAMAIYLTWSLITRDWHITWIVWPVAGILFGMFAALEEGFASSNKKRN